MKQIEQYKVQGLENIYIEVEVELKTGGLSFYIIEKSDRLLLRRSIEENTFYDLLSDFQKSLVKNILPPVPISPKEANVHLKYVKRNGLQVHNSIKFDSKNGVPKDKMYESAMIAYS